MRRLVPILCVALVLAACAVTSDDPPPVDQPQAEPGSDRDTSPKPTSDAPRSGIGISDDGRYLIDGDGQPWLLKGDAAWSLLAQLTEDEAVDYLDARRDQGFNALVVNLIEHEFADDPPLNANGDGPFLSPGDFSTPNPAYFDHVDRVLELAAERDFVALLAPAYLGANGGDEGWYAEITANGVDALEEYGRYVGERFERFTNIVWLEGGDYTPPPEPGLALVDAVVRGIKAIDPDSLHLASWSHETSGLDVGADWIDVNTIYTYQPVHLESADQYLQHPGTPLILFEAEYEAEAEFTTPHLLRGQAYHALLTGAAGHVYGHGAIWPFTPDWRRALAAPGAASMSHLSQLFADLAWHELVPDLDGEILTNGAGRSDGRSRVVAAASTNRDLAVVYVPEAPSVELDLSSFGEPVQTRFYDPTDGSYSAGAQLAPGPGAILDMPGENAAGDSDWVALLEPVG